VVDEDTKYAVCNTCQVKVSRGESNTKLYRTTNLVSHLAKHPDVNTQYSERNAAEETPPRKETCKRKLKHKNCRNRGI